MDVSEYIKVGLSKGKNKVDIKDVENMIHSVSVSSMSINEEKPKTTIVQCVLKNGFVITESSSCVDHKNYDKKIGAKICMNRIKDKVWELLGFLLQSIVSTKTSTTKEKG